ncbi:hypothetical protein EDB19DRAFT_1923676 [Suillus lakei]|nr:hypothetical protein EDB19DRAFT_1923676 [Suillus lakei]
MSPAGETGTSSTPPRANAPAHGASKIESTPNSRGAAVVSENISLVGVRIKEVRPWIQRDIEQAKQCKADAMLQALLQRASCSPETEQPELLQKCLKEVLPVCNGQVSAGGIRSSGVETALKKYVRPGVENNFYAPFIEATNIALACLQEIKVDGMRAPVPAVDMICQQNDMPMYQHHQSVKSTRKPDCVILPLNSAYAAFEDEKDHEKDDMKHDTKRKAQMVKNAMAKPPAPLPWEDVLACIEFKRKPPGKKQGIKPPLPSSYGVKDYVPTKPEYLPVNHLKAPATQPASDTAPVISSGLTAAQPSEGGSRSKRKADVTVQTGLYAAEMFAANLAVNYLINLIVTDDVMWIWYYDRQGTIQSSGINFVQDLPRFMVLLYALQRFRLEDWGRNKDFLPVQVEGKQCHEFKIKDEELGEVDLLLHTSHAERVTHYGLQGRATNVVPVTSEALSKKYGNFQDGMVAKIFWGEVNRTSEPEILKRVEEIAEAHDTVKDHIPELLWHHTFTNPTSCQSEKRSAFQNPPRAVVCSTYLCSASSIPSRRFTAKTFSTCGINVSCVRIFIALMRLLVNIPCRPPSLWKEGVYHRDVSAGNLMWYWKDGKRMGVLNDYDLSSLADVQGPLGNERTGTVPFMALELLSAKAQRGEVKHLYRHDLESFMWVFIWLCLRYRDGVLLPADLSPLDEWARLNAVACGEKKDFFLRHMPDCPAHIELRIWLFLVQCVYVLKKDTDRRHDLRLEKILMPGAAEQSNDGELEDIDGFLRMFTNTKSWVELSELSNPSQ